MHSNKSVATLCALLVITACGAAQTSPEKRASYFTPNQLLSSHVLPTPPSETSKEASLDLKTVRAIERTRSKEQVAQAAADDKEEDIFIFEPVLGPAFNKADMPVTSAISAHIHMDEGIASAPFKGAFARLRPYQTDHDLHPVCKLTDLHNSYPSGHALGGYLFALTMVEILPEKSDVILQRADQYAQNRVVCGVHYPSDVQASRELAYLIFGNMLTNAKFQADLAAARAEVRHALNLPPTP